MAGFGELAERAVKALERIADRLDALTVDDEGEIVATEPVAWEAEKEEDPK